MWRYRHSKPVLAPGEVSIDELAAMVGVKTRAIRIWQKAGVLGRGVRRGRYMGFDEELQVRARAIGALLRQMRSLQHVATALAELDEAGLRKLAGLPEPSVEAPPDAALHAPAGETASEVLALPQVDARHDAPPELEATGGEADSQAAPAAPTEPGWRSIPLLPGLELRVRDDASILVQRVADSIVRGGWLP